MQAIMEESIRRNALREGKAYIQPIEIWATAKKLVPPTYREGFDEIYTVTMNKDNTFTIQPTSHEI
ncbi:hypothetical protein LX64_03319 [Chitinophaga skermanii]|uniref:Uncharacterized protein n=1 Tax=Chitinophaga skermanii TaxID=331697 RepID=A0A327QCV7_9BACT|nr:hypothetical protein [Chitinophaga skermanii]RAJ02310.1 hypothetical protein LX64_03319 [Chitinophaga skermanii]